MPSIRWVSAGERAVAAYATPLRVDSAAAMAAAAAELRPVVDPPMAPRDEALFLLGLAAEVEHSLLVQYLYAAFSLGGPAVPADRRDLVAGWRAGVLAIAREEMAHLATVQNLLRLLGGPVRLEREDYPFRGEFYPFHFRLEPLSKNSLAKYVVAEMPRLVTEDDEIAAIRKRAATADFGRQPNRVGALYRRIADLLGTLDDDDLSPESAELAGDPAEWTHGLPDLIARRPQTVRDAIDAIDAIAEQGEGPLGTASEIRSQSHYWRFLDLYRRFPEPEDWHATFRAPTDPNTDADPASDPARELGRITHPRARGWAHLANQRYRRLLICLAHALQTRAATPDGRERDAHAALVSWAFAEMHQLSRLTAILTALPRTAANDGQVAALPFELPYSLTMPDVESARWRLHDDILDTSAALIDSLLNNAPPAERDLLTAIKAQDDRDREIIASLGAPRIKELKEVRILPPLAIGRFGSSPEPLDNYEARIVDVTGYRRIEPAPTLRIDPVGGHVQDEVTPDAVRFRDREGKVRPIAPFFELWARFTDDGDLQPLTLAHLAALGLKPSDVRWQVSAANMKAARRTGEPGDRVLADTGVFADHELHALAGRAENFKPGKAIPFGSVRYIRPTAQFPEIRFRFTPGPGRTYGPEPNDPLTVDDVYDAQKGAWDGHWDGDPSAPTPTFPSGTYEGTYEAQTERYVSVGYFDDSCDGIATVQLTCGATSHTASARFCSGVPDFAPDGFQMRTLGDDLLQALLGPSWTEAVSRDAVSDILRRTMETVRLMNTSAMNADQGIGGVATNTTNQVAHEAGEFGRAFEPMFGQGRAPYYPTLKRHEALVNAWNEGTLPLPPDLLRSYDEAGDLSGEGHHRMPALMRGSDLLPLALTRRQIELLRKAAREHQTPSTPEQAMKLMIQFFQNMAALHDHIPVDGNRFLAQLFANPPELLAYLKTAVARGPLSGTEQNRPLIVPGDPEASALVHLISRVDHPMHGPLGRIIPGTSKTGIQIVTEWIASLR